MTDGPRVLLLSDEGTPCVESTTALSGAGFHVHGASCADEAFDIACRNRIDVLVADIRLAESHALGLFRRFRRDSMLRRVGIVATSALGYDTLADARAAGAEIGLARPFLPPLLVAAARNVLRPLRASRRA